MQALSCDMSHGLLYVMYDSRLLALRAHCAAIYNCRETLRLGNASQGMQAREHWLGRAPAGHAKHRCSSPLSIALHKRLSRASHD